MVNVCFLQEGSNVPDRMLEMCRIRGFTEYIIEKDFKGFSDFVYKGKRNRVKRR